jgi:hypothetical protein
MSTSQRLRKIRRNQSHDHSAIPPVQAGKTIHLRRLHHLRAIEMEPKSVWLVGRRPPLKNYPIWWRELARFVYRRIGWTADYGIEYMGIFTEEGAARHAAGCDGGFFMELPLNASLPEETGQFGKHDFPFSEASQEYRNRKLPYLQIPRSELERLQEKIRDTDPIVERFKAKTA